MTSKQPERVGRYIVLNTTLEGHEVGEALRLWADEQLDVEKARKLVYGTGIMS